MKKAALHNLGCKVNAYETEAMKQQLENNGYEIVSFHDKADIYVINTCTVTNIADRKSRQMLHKAKKMNSKAIVVAVGCYVQAAKEQLEKDEAIDIVIGNNKKKDLIAIIENFQIDHNLSDTIININETNEFEELTLVKQAEHTRANIKIQDGCNQFCSYCIIPYTRGRVRSRACNDVINEVKALVGNGYKEFVLTGIHLSSYGIDFEDGTNLLTVIKAISELQGVERIRLGSLEPRIITEEFAMELSKIKQICPHFHLSLQSGCDETLKRMNRSYTTSQYYEKCLILRKHFDNPAITTDVIVGFPGETEEEFAQTVSFLKKVDFASMHIFKYSVRQGTKAASMQNQISDSVKNNRSDTLLALSKALTNQYHSKWINKNVVLLIEEEIEIGNEKYLVGHTPEYVKGAIKYKENLINKLIEVKTLASVSDEILLAEMTNIV